MRRTSAKVTNRWAKENYDRIGITVPKGMRDRVRGFAKGQGMSVNQLINMLLRDEIRIPKDEWGFAVGYNPYMEQRTV